MSERTRYRFNRRANPPALLAELQAAGIPVGLVNPGNGYTEVDLYPEDFDRAATVVQAHDAAGVDATEAQARVARAQVRQTILAYPGKASPTAAETAAAVRALCLAVAALAREG